jgi:hypothetical protein
MMAGQEPVALIVSHHPRTPSVTTIATATATRTLTSANRGV